MMEIDNDDKEHNKLWCIGTNQDYEKEYLRLTGVYIIVFISMKVFSFSL